MKKTILFLIIFALCKLTVFSQTVFWSDNFDFNQGWALSENWNISGGKLQFNWSSSIVNFDLSAVSSAIDLDNNIEDLIIIQSLDVLGASTTPEVAEIYLLTSGEEHLLWSHSLDAGGWGSSSGTEIVFDISNFAGQTVQFKFRTFGQSAYNWNWWWVFDMKLTALYANDLAATNITGPNIVSTNTTATWTVKVNNLGLQPQSGFTVSMLDHKTGEMIGSVEVTDTIPAQETMSIVFDWTPTDIINTTFYAVVDLENDEFNGNDASKSHFIRVKPDIAYSLLVWDNDNGISSIVCPETGDLVRPTVVLTRALDKAGIGYQLDNSLPTSLSEFDVIFISHGNFCLS
ncbi:MAG: hypothetical protein IH597_04445 [Bacteroidales bacterium]|nr:hypothetical protein [Bacteroidales bacterium]